MHFKVDTQSLKNSPSGNNMSFSHHQQLPQSAIAEQQQLKSCLDELSHVLAMHQESDLYNLVESWWTNFEFKKGSLWQLLDTNVSNLKDVFDYKFLSRRCSLPRAVERNRYHVEFLLNNLEHGNWMDQWSAVTSEHLDNALNTWNYEYFNESESESEEDEEDDIDGRTAWPPPAVNPQIWFTTTVAAFEKLENAFDSLNTIYVLQDEAFESTNINFGKFQTEHIQEPLKLLTKTREFLISMSPVGGTLKKQHAKLAWCIFAEKLLDSCLKTQNLVFYA